MKKSAILLFFICLTTGGIRLFSQQNADTKPLELPNFIIEGREQLNVQSGIKQFPEKISYLSKSQMDSLNSLEKQQSLLLPQKQLPNSLMSFDFMKGFVTAQFGRFTTPAAEIGYNLNTQGFNLFGNGGFELSSGDVKNSDYSKFFIKLNSAYLADEKFLVFGGSKTTTNIQFKSENYKLYAIPTAPKRVANHLDLLLSSDGSYEGFDFLTGASFKSLGFSQTGSIPANGSDNSLKGWLKFRKDGKEEGFGANAILDFHTFRGQSVNKMDIFGDGKLFFKDFIVMADVGFQIAHNSLNESMFNFLVDAKLDYFLTKNTTIQGELSSKLDNGFFMDYFSVNPYLADTVNIDFGNLTDIKIQMKYEPTENLKLNLGFDYSIGSRSPYFSKVDSTGTFILNYEKATYFSFFMGAIWQASSKDAVLFDFRFLKSSLPDSKSVPFQSPMNFSVKYNRNWLENFGSEIAFVYIGERYSDKMNKFGLANYYDLKLHAYYKFSKAFMAFADLNNILNNDINIWSGYKERNVFFNIGITWLFN